MAWLFGILAGAISMVALLQGVAWLGPRTGVPRARRGAALAVLGTLGLGVSLVASLVPGLFA